jgi:hydrogenase expression/formation protein HypE
MCAQTILDLNQVHPGPLQAGKLPPALLAQLLTELPTADPALLLGPTVGEDAAVIDFAPDQDRLLVAKSDPITFATDEIGYYAVNVCANDLAVIGATPRFYMPTLLLPAEQSDADLAARIFGQIGQACREMGVVIAGGHSEITHAVKQPIVAGTMLGEVQRDRFVHSGNCRVGDVVMLAGTVPIEGASIVARERAADLITRGWSREDIRTAADYLYAPGISVLQAAHAAVETGLVHAMHDPTEGGIATGLLELALAGKVGLTIDLDAIPVPTLAQRLCAAFGLDPLGTIASGALLATTSPAAVPVLRQAWVAVGCPVSVIGRILPAEMGLHAQRHGVDCPFPYFAVDEITRIFA